MVSRLAEMQSSPQPETVPSAFASFPGTANRQDAIRVAANDHEHRQGDQQAEGGQGWPSDSPLRSAIDGFRRGRDNEGAREGRRKPQHDLGVRRDDQQLVKGSGCPG